MAFVFTVEDGTGLAGANSYASLDEADDYLTANIHVYTKWAALTDENKESLLAFASRVLDQRTSWLGEKAVAASALRWPRTGCSDRDGNDIASTVVPSAVKSATIELAAAFIDADRTVERGSDGLKELQVDVVKFVFDENFRLAAIPANIGYILTGIGYVSSGERGFKRIVKV
jgi:hypothetical protein